MLTITELAQDKFKEYFQNQESTRPIRVFMFEGGCGGPSLQLALDDQKGEDEVFEVEGLTYLVDKDLLNRMGDIRVDFVDDGSRSGFSVSAANHTPAQCGSGCCC